MTAKDASTPLTKLIHYSKIQSDFTVRVLNGLVWSKLDLLIRLALQRPRFKALWMADIYCARSTPRLCTPPCHTDNHG